MADNIAASSYAVAAHIAGADGGWDFASIDQQTGTLFVARSNGVMAVDLASQTVTNIVVEGFGVHGVLPLPGTSFAISTNGATANAFLFDKSTGKIDTTLQTGQSPDALLLEPKSGLVVIFNGKSHDASLVDIKTKTVVGTIALEGKPEAAVADGDGQIFVNLEDKGEIAIIDVASRNVVATYPLKDCEKPTGLIFDAKTGILISACGNKIAKVIDAKDGHDLKTLDIGKGPDAVLLDETRRLAFIPTSDGTLSVVALRSLNDIALIETITTMPGAKTGALDPATGKIYLPSAKLKPAEQEGARPVPIPGSFEILVVAPKS
jgi:DNA-binding beta-propeller fold protein YncE